MAGDTGMAGKVALLLWAQTLGLAGAQTTQILVEPPWTPPVLWDQVTLTCQGLGTASATTWYKDGRRWWQERHDRLNVTESGTYECDRPGTGLSPPVTVLDDDLVLQVPARALLEGDTVTLRCRGRWNSPVTKVRFFKDENNLTRSLNATELSLSPLQLNHSGSYRCKGWVRSWPSGSAAVTVTVHGEHPHGWNSHLLTAPKSQCTLSHSPHLPSPSLTLSGAGAGGSPKPTTGSPLTLSSLSTPSPLRLQATLLHFPSCSTGTGRWWGARRGPRSCWCLPWGSPTQGITAARCPLRGEGCAEEQHPTPFHGEVNVGMGTGSAHCLLWSPAWGPPCPPDKFLGSPLPCPVSPHPSVV
ncbi:low affinity immunoglobulin gamma Fc region receptor II-like isoform X3 [Haemorhous mexicanus]|uniref:low affinity immunoglobulin gamma Fc region receptor II-like isoform X3 n=1 Tax=Haemorhous mexicanus TaxID=30427 RepID=UPI0028BE10B7|nr:low affinity immunoglobulin gamma Fc region receptor II-like isoform X3 [Haemorhous mexicanus]